MSEQGAAAQIMKRCPSCGFLPLPDATHCPKCGKPIESAASVDWEKLAHHFADELAERWHRPDSAHALPLAQFMGLSDAQYAAWVECRYDDVLAGGDNG